MQLEKSSLTYLINQKDDKGNTPHHLIALNKGTLSVVDVILANTTTFESKEKGQDEGSAVLVRKSVFQAFVVTDTLAMVLSTSSVSLHLVLTLKVSEATFFDYFQLTTSLTICMPW